MRAIAAGLGAVSLVLVALGGYVRGTGAGLACPDWPLCYGRIVPDELKPGIAQEVGHRYLASIVSFGTMGFAILAFINRRSYPRLWSGSRIALLLLAIQVVLGGLTVLLQLNPFIVTAHLAVGTIFFQLLMWLATERMPGLKKREDIGLMKRPPVPEKSWLVRLMFLLCAGIFLQILLGGFVGASGASLACPDLPLCFGSLLPEHAGGAQVVHMIHRATGILLFALSLALTIWVRPLSRGRKKKRGHLAGITGLIFLQILVGISNIYFRVPVSNAVTHLVLAQLILFGALSYFRRITPRSSMYLNSEHAMNDVEFGEYTPTKRRFAANIR